MYTQIEKSKDNKSRAVANSVGQKKSNVRQGIGIEDNQPEGIAQRSTIKHATGLVTQCQCAMCSNAIQAQQKNERPISNNVSRQATSAALQRKITVDNAAGAGNDTAINSYLGNFSGNLSGTSGLWDNTLKKTNMGTRSQLNTAAKNTAMSVAVDTGGTVFRTEGTYDFNTAVKGTSSEDVQRLGTRSGGEHSEVYLFNKGHTTGSIACAIDNCFFCNNFLEWKGLQHDEMKKSYVFPEMWEPPGSSWRIVKEMTSKHEMDPNKSGKRWTIDNPRGNTKGVYFDEANQK